MTDVIKTSVAVDQADVVGFLKEKYFAMKEAISDAEERHQKAVDSLNEPKAKTGIAKHEAALLKSRITKTKESIRVTKKALTDLKEDLGETKDEIQENKVRHYDLIMFFQLNINLIWKFRQIVTYKMT